MNNQRQNAIMTIIRCVIIAVIMFILSVVTSTFINILFVKIGFSVEFWDSVSNLSNGVIAAVAAGLVLFQLKQNANTEKHQSDIEEATFIFQYNQSFIQDPNMVYIEDLLEQYSFYKKAGTMITDDNRQKFINYLVYLEGLAPLILGGVLDISHIDDLMAYRFFLIINNPDVQKDQLKAFPEYYRGCFKLYKKWSKYRKEHDREILFEQSSLDKWEGFEKYAI